MGARWSCCAEHENHLLARSTSLDDLREAFEQRLVAIGAREGGHTQAVVERVAWPGVAPANLFDARDREILGGVPSFPTPSLMFPSLGTQHPPAALTAAQLEPLVLLERKKPTHLRPSHTRRHAHNTRNNTHLPIAERKLQPVMAWDVEDRSWRAISPDARQQA